MLKSFGQKAWSAFKDFLSPPRCAHCACLLAERNPLCASCIAMIQPVVSCELMLTAQQSLKVYALGAYQEPLKSLILAKGWRNHVASMQLAELMVQRMNLAHIEADVLVPIPLHWTRYAYRGFNQADIMAHVLAKTMNIPVISLLKRYQKTIYQAGLSAQERAANVKNALYCTSEAMRYQGARIVLVDDLMTTGSTLYAAGKGLLKIKPQSLTALVAGRVI